MTSDTLSPRVAVLLCTHNGARFLNAQLASISAQTHQNWVVWASDDGSTDATLSILQNAHTQWGSHRLVVVQGPQAGSSANFLSLACRPDIQADYFAFCDQDDIWHADKIQRAIHALRNADPKTPTLYMSRSRLIDEAGQLVGYSRIFRRKPGFGNALVQNIGGGNTMVFNAAARELLMTAGADVPVVVHDWWAYLVVTGCGGIIINDEHPSLDYRQHGGNQIGSNRGVWARLARARELLSGRFRVWADINVAAMSRLETRLTAQNREVLQAFRALRQGHLIARLIGLSRSGIYRQSFIDNLGLYLAAALNRL